ncbi:methyl-accepting chemotaxis protein [Vibrio viridaestus]|uniref:Methyl-accepting chemotaxis protein n=1 Tax=Vibrio viridaestus TaxID=2487322 RepID=A0A3N9TEL7_9VIBR|nr:methyl-accepting chemotaxis protein [Vibrio viridaestus]RQW62559.1 methyl-accepting chemotaxis protein [Vibrio viridaestus]
MRWLANRSIKIKLLIIILLMTFLSLSIAGFGVFKMNQVAHEIKGIADENIPLIQLTSDITVKQLQSSVILEKALRALEVPLDSGNGINSIDNLVSRFETLSSTLDNEVIQAKALTAIAVEHALTPKIKTKAQELHANLSLIIEHHKQYEESAERILSSIRQGDDISAISNSLQDLESLQSVLNKELSLFLVSLESITQEAVVKTELDEEHALYGMTIIAGISLALGLLIGFIISKKMVSSLQVACEFANQIAMGDFSNTIDDSQNDEVGTLLKAMNKTSLSLKNMVQTILASSETLAATVTELAEVARSNKEAVDVQQENTDQVATAMHQMSATINEVAGSAENTASSTKGADENIKRSCLHIDTTQAITKRLVEKTEQSQLMIADLQSSTEQIQHFVVEVNAIAEQTNLLALNAAIEAARAGDQGRGFAVVADEVRALATRSQGATNQISSLIEKLVKNSRSAVDTIQTNGDDIREISSLINESKSGIDEIAAEILSLSDSNVQIASASEEQAVAAEEISRSMVGIRDTGELIVASTRETEEASESLAQLAHQLQDLMHQFKISA